MASTNFMVTREDMRAYREDDDMTYASLIETVPIGHAIAAANRYFYMDEERGSPFLVAPFLESRAVAAEQIAVGAEGITFVIQTESGKRFALKWSRRMTFDATFRLMNLIARSDYVVGVYGFARSKNFDDPRITNRLKEEWMLMEYCPGIVLYKAELSDQAIWMVFCDLLSALYDLRTSNRDYFVAHNDLHSRNVMLCNGRAKLVDFGLAVMIPKEKPANMSERDHEKWIIRAGLKDTRRVFVIMWQLLTHETAWESVKNDSTTSELCAFFRRNTDLFEHGWVFTNLADHMLLPENARNDDEWTPAVAIDVIETQVLGKNPGEGDRIRPIEHPERATSLPALPARRW